MPRLPRRRSWSHSSRRLTVVFVVVLVPAAATLVWLGLRLLEQDRALRAQRDIERQEAAADAIVRSLSQSIADVERRLADGEAIEGALLIERSGDRLDLRPRGMVAWTPMPAVLTNVDSRPFAAAEQLEFQGSPGAALAVYQRLAQSADTVAVRLGALLRAARVNRLQGNLEAAIAHYRALAQHAGFAIGGAPADLVARRRICELLLASGAAAEHRREADALEREFTAGHWSLSESDWELTAADITRWTNRALPSTATQRAMSAAVAQITVGDPPRTPVGHRVLVAADTPVTLLWRGTGAQLTAVALLPETVRLWVAGAAAQYPANALEISLLSEGGAALVKSGMALPGRTLRRSAGDTGLPWTITLARGPGWPGDDEFAGRRQILMAGLAALGLLLSTGAYLLWRVVQRELAVARLQAEFVSAVSHEFRTPVTSLRHVIELLEEDDELPRERRRSFYAVLGRSTERLDRLVESLLDFARMEDGRKPYDLRPLDAVAFARSVAADFERHADASRHQIVVDAVNAPGLVSADEEALGHALWNLLDNAVKYSPSGGVITVTVAPHALGAAISVRDCGLGVPRQEQREIFTKFVRGAGARRLGIKGTGVGLAIVSHIARGHGGRVELESEEGKGSTFRLVLPSAA